MTTYCWRLLVAVSFVLALMSPLKANACVTTSGEKIKHIGDASPQVRHNYASGKVGYKYGYYGILWIDVWTYGGAYCVYEGDRYNAIEPDEAARLLGINENDLSKPFFYRMPPGLPIVAVLLVIWIVYAVNKRTNQTVAAPPARPTAPDRGEITDANNARTEPDDHADRPHE